MLTTIKKKLLFEGITRANKKWIGDDANALVYNNPRSVLEGEKIQIDFDYEPSNSSNFFKKILNKIRELN